MNLDEYVMFTKHAPLSLEGVRDLIKSVNAVDVNKEHKYEMYVPNSRIGIEVEVEKARDVRVGRAKNGFRWWRGTDDGSLRNGGVEFVTNGGLYSKYIPYALYDLFNMSMGEEVEFSDRTSIHVHIDMRRVPVLKLVSMMVLFTMFERVFYEIIERHGISRTNNIFCTSVSATNIYPQFTSMFKHWLNEDEGRVFDVIKTMAVNWGKYSNMNILPLFDAKQGTMEFRMLHGTRDFDFVVRYVDMLLRMKIYSLRTSVQDLYNTLTNLNVNSQYELLAKSLFGEDIYNRLLSKLNLQALMEGPVEEMKTLCLYNNIPDRVMV